MKYTRLGDLLVDAGYITDEQLNHALTVQKEKHQRLGETLVSEGIITERNLIDALTMQLGIDFIDLTETSIDPEMTRLVSKNLAKRFSVVPVRVRGDELYLAMVDPLNFIAIEEIRAASRKRIVPMIATQSAMDHAISVLYGTEGARRAIREMQNLSDISVRSSDSVVASELADEESDAAPSVRLVDNIIERAISERASDIHIEPHEDNVVVRNRVDGVLHRVFDIPKDLQASVISRVKVMCGMDVTERRVPQDGRAIVRVKMAEVDLRVSTLPTVKGEKIVIRLLDRSQRLNTAEELGFSGVNLELFNKLLEGRQGLILMAGPTGSGKSSTQFAMIEALNTDEVNITTLEDPVEFNLEGVNQVQVDDRTGTSFASGLRSILRQDPDIVSVGEIRDSETAVIALRAAITGHLVLSTVHTPDAISAALRLENMGVEPFMLSTALKGVIAQRLVRRICPHCATEHEATWDELELLGIRPGSAEAKGVRLRHGAGCPECFGTGYRGRIVVPEVLVVTNEMRRAIAEGAGIEELRRLADAAGFQTMAQAGRELVLTGVTSAEELKRGIYVTD